MTPRQMVADLAPGPAARRYVDLWAGPLVLNTWLGVACLGLAVLVLGLVGAVVYLGTAVAHVKPIVVRIDAVGRAEAVAYDEAAAWKPQVPELRYLLTRFLELHRGRFRATVARDYPNSLLFFASSQATALLRGPTPVDTFAANPGADEVEVDVKNVTFSNLSTPPYQAAVDFTERGFTLNSRDPSHADDFTAQITFTIRDAVPSYYLRVNPLGIQITHLRIDQAFTAARRVE